MRILVLGDTHGHDTWKDIVAKEEFDKVVFLGDYVDSFTIPPDVIKKNLEDLSEYKRKMGKRCVLLYGNHDHSYWNAERCSGYKFHSATDYCRIFKPLIEEGLMEIVHIEGDIIMSHAGVSEYWLKEVAGLESPHDITFEKLNDTNAGLDLLNWNMFTGYDGYGNTISQSPIWIRPQALLNCPLKGWRQIVGHTHLDKCVTLDGIWFNDKLPEAYIVIEDGDIEFVPYAR